MQGALSFRYVLFMGLVVAVIAGSFAYVWVTAINASQFSPSIQPVGIEVTHCENNVLTIRNTGERSLENVEFKIYDHSSNNYTGYDLHVDLLYQRSTGVFEATGALERGGTYYLAVPGMPISNFNC